MGKKFEFNITGKFRIKNKSIKTIIQRVVQKCTEIILKRKQSIAWRMHGGHVSVKSNRISILWKLNYLYTNIFTCSLEQKHGRVIV